MARRQNLRFVNQVTRATMNLELFSEELEQRYKSLPLTSELEFV